MGRPHRRKKRKEGKLLPITSLGSICISTGYTQQYQDTSKRNTSSVDMGYLGSVGGVNERCKVYLGPLTPWWNPGGPYAEPQSAQIHSLPSLLELWA